MSKKAYFPRYSDKWTDEQLQELEKVIAETYQEAYTDVKRKTNAYLRKLIPRLIGEYESGKYTDEQWMAYLQAQIGRGERWVALQQLCAERITHANEIAHAYINDTTPGIYSLNANYEAYTIEQMGAGIDFNLVNEQTVKQLMRSNWVTTLKPPLLTLDAAGDTAYNAAVFHNALIQSIIQGESVMKLATRLPVYKQGQQEAEEVLKNVVKEGLEGIPKKLATEITHKAKVAALRQARTAVTGAQNAGRMATYEAASNMGITVVKRWLCTLDDRTRDSHRDVDGERVPYDQPFSNGLMFPGDRNGAPGEWWNCRCTLVTDDIESVNMGGRRAKDMSGEQSYTVQYMTYSKWEEWKLGKR